MKKYRKAVFIVTYSREKNKIEYLILKRKLHWIGWEFPKGGIEKLESKEKAVKRETKEETGLKIIKIINHHISKKYKYKKALKDRPGIIGQDYSIFSARVKKSKVKVDNIEHSGYKWVDFNMALKKLTWPDQKKCLRKVNEYLEEHKE